MYGAGGGRAKAERKGGVKEEAGPGGTGTGGNRVELLVFGYACKLFRDDERALAQEQGQHLIPWMGDHKILIDRYDGRGHLHDLSAYDAEYATWNRDYQLSEEEARVEALCDEERYLALHTDLLEEEARQEEEYKRLSEALAEDGNYSAVGFTYGSDYYDPSEPTEEEEPSKQREKSEAENLEENEEPFIAPLGLSVPSDVELPPTAKMHAIIERTANFVCKQGAQFEIMLKAKQARNSQFDFLRFDHYLNPYYKFIQKAMKEGRYTVLAESKSEEKKKSGPTSDNEEEDDEEDGSYLHPSLFASKKSSRLEELMKPLKVVDPDHPLAALVRKAQADSSAPAPPTADGTPAQPSQVEYTADSTVAAMYYSYYMLPDGTYCLAPPPPGIDVATYYSTLPAGVTVSSSPGVTTTVPPPPGTTPPPPPTTAESSSGVTSTTTTTSALAPVAIIPPPPDIQPVIDKLAEYVARNGLKFETSVRAKNDQRFEFLQPWHQYNAYYEFKKQFFLQKEGGGSTQAASTAEEAPTETAVEESSEAGEDGAPEASFAPISFAIKAKENDLLPLEKNRVKLDDDSEEDEESRECQESTSSVANPSPAAAPPSAVVEEKKPQLTQEELEAKQAKQKLEDRLAAAAREKLAQASKESKEKQLQAERKRKAALFLQTLKNPLPDAEVGKLEESTFGVEETGVMPCPLLVGGRTLPMLEGKPPERPSSRCRDPPREEEREKKKKKHKKRSRTRSRSPKYHSSSKPRSRSHSKAKHSLPSAYRTVRRSRSRSRSPRRRAHSPERRREDRSVPTAYRMSGSPGVSRKRTRSRSPHEKKKKRRSRSRTKAKARSQSTSPSKQAAQRPSAHSAHSASISPVESRGSSQERSRGVSQEKDGQISSAIVSSVQSKITQDLMAKVRAMLAASKNLQTSAS
ncbi:splicing factor, suppressor of white-apricot homolog isoform X6 [Rattus norvegicus]|uniref:Splicing factor, suppressor of white-apricot homolog n=1 Tax=Rattus norvegicus TaxID=10116 RepID=A0A1W2Q681_RAT|nr:splicing factor, suppressor of white-apricot homolog isoform X7 [Rattus norvegicus]|eukprot:XP_006249335.1 PREDICTED: splicing factor, suppressor of white-apricot homolog isoform X6 [Rattus norvegicus]